MSGFRPVRVSAIHEAHQALGATLADRGAWRVPEVYLTAEDEVLGARTGVGLADVSAGAKLEVRGEDVDALLPRLGLAEGLRPGRGARGDLDGDAVLLARLAPDALLVLGEAEDGGGASRALETACGALPCAHLFDVTAGLTVLDVVGPRARGLLARLSPLDLDALTPLGVAQGALARVHAILVRLDRPVGPAYRALVGREHGAFVWEALMHAGHDLGIVPVGARARRRLDATG